MLELKRSINNKSFLFCLLEVLFTFIIAYFLLVGLDKIENVTIEQFSFSAYTVMTQFGMMIYSVVMINSINHDYRDKNILFMKKNGISATMYLIKKILIMTFWFSLLTSLIYMCICIAYGDFTYFLIMMSYFLNAIIYTIIISAFCGFIFKNILVAYGVNLFVWLSGIITVAMIPSARFIAYYDASNIMYENLETYLEIGNAQLLAIGEGFIYNMIILAIVIFASLLTSKVWVKNGVR